MADSLCWWAGRPMRLAQTNLREIDAGLDLDQYVAQLKSFRADIALFNVGGIVANYPTRLPFHFRNPFLEGDLVGRVVERLHREDIRMIGRFDFSKVDESIASAHPDWLYRSPAGATVNYNGKVHTCVNGGYQQERLFDILGEAVDAYPLDGVFFNMIGYTTRDYSGNHYGPCHCEACRRRFRAARGLDLPAVEDSADPVFRQYAAFRSETSAELFHRVRDFIKGKRGDLAICTYTPEGVDVIRRESNSAVDRALPEWNYSASDNVKSALCSYRGKGISNAAVHFVDIPFRHAAVSEHLTGLRLAQNMAHGGWLDFYVIGTLEGQEDRAGVGRARSIFQFHAAHQPWLDAPVSKADICLIKAGNAEYKGLFRLLAQGHFVFDAAELAPLAAGKAPKALEDYALVILPDLQNLGDAEARRLEQYAAGGGRLLATGATATRNAIGDPRGGFGLEALGVKPGYETRTKRHADYLRIRPEDKARLGADRLKPFDLCFLFSNFLECEPAEATESLLRLIPAGMYGPPEKCYYGGESGTAGLFFSRRGKGACAFLPWGLGAMAQTLANPAHGALFEGAIEDLLGYRRRLIVEGSPLLEASWRASADGRFEWVALVNHSGQNGTAFLEPAEIHGTRLNLRPGGATSQARALRAGASLPFAQSADGWISLNLPPIGPFEWIVLEFGS